MSTRNDDSCQLDVRTLYEKILAPKDEVLQWDRPKVCIFRVPKFLKDLNEKAYIPQMLSLGPLHHGFYGQPSTTKDKLSTTEVHTFDGQPSTTEDKLSTTEVHTFDGQPSTTEDKLSITEVHKVRAVKRMLDRCRPEKQIQDVIGEIRKLEMQIKECYEVPIPYGGDKLAWIFALDGCFILEILRAAAVEFGDSENSESERSQILLDGKQLNCLPGYLMLRDIMLLENQVPLVVLTRLLELELGSMERALKKLCKLSVSILERSNPFGEPPEALNCQLDDILNSKHLLDLLRTKIISSFLQCEKRSNNKCNCIEHNGCSCLPESADESISMPSAEILRHAGIEFGRCGGKDQRCIGFRRKARRIVTATLFLPAIVIDDSTETILRNLIAYEECRVEPDNRISLYAMLIDDFLESKNDVVVLKKAGVIRAEIGSDKEVAALFNNLCKGITERENKDFDSITSAVKKHYKNRPKVLFAEFVEGHCSKPWLVISVVAGVVLLVMTLVQTVFAIIDR